jgi:hypothetical protein
MFSCSLHRRKYIGSIPVVSLEGVFKIKEYHEFCKKCWEKSIINDIKVEAAIDKAIDNDIDESKFREV